MIRHVAAVAFAGFAALIVAGCGGPPTTPPGSPAGTDTSSVESATAAFHQALRVNDLETFMSYVADDVFFMPPGEPPVRGHDALRTWMTAFLEQYRTSSLTLADREVHVGGGWAVELGTFEWALQPAAGGSVMVDRGNYMQVWKQQGDGSWRFAREVYNSSVPTSAK